MKAVGSMTTAPLLIFMIGIVWILVRSVWILQHHYDYSRKVSRMTSDLYQYVHREIVMGGILNPGAECDAIAALSRYVLSDECAGSTYQWCYWFWTWDPLKFIREKELYSSIVQEALSTRGAAGMLLAKKIAARAQVN